MFVKFVCIHLIKSSRKPNSLLANLRSFLLFCCIFLLGTFATQASANQAFAEEAAGRIIMARGEVIAVSENGAIRNLQRRDSIFNHEIIRTGNNSKVQIRFIDNALLALKANSELKIQTYVFSDKNSEENKVIMDLVTGGFRTLTGKIGKGNKAAYKIHTPAASIGIRGTLYEILLTNDGLLAAVWKGGISIETQQGQFDLGINADFDFAKVSANGAFSGLLSPPAAFAPPISSSDQTSLKKNHVNLIDHAMPDDHAVPGPFEKDKHTFSAAKIRDALLQQDKEGELVLTEEFKNSFENDPASLSQIIESLGFTAENINPPPFIGDASDIDLRLTSAEMDQLNESPRVAYTTLDQGRRVSVINTNGSDSGEVFFVSQKDEQGEMVIDEVIRRGSALEQNLTRMEASSDLVEWGIWQGATATPIQSYTSANSTAYSPIEQDLLYLIATPATQSDLQTGLVSGRFSTSTMLTTDQTNYLARASNGGVISSLSAGFDLTIDQDNATPITISNIQLDLEVTDLTSVVNSTSSIDLIDPVTGESTLFPDQYTDSSLGINQYWSLTASTGTVDGANISIDNLTGYAVDNTQDTSSNASGSLSGSLLAPGTSGTVDTFAGEFNIYTDNGSDAVNGVVILQSGQ